MMPGPAQPVPAPRFGEGACSVCARRISRTQAAGPGICDSPDCRKARALRDIAQENSRRQQLRDELRARTPDARSRAGIDEGRRYALAVMPAHVRPLVDQDPERVARFAERLRGVISDARRGQERDEARDPEEAPHPDAPPPEVLEPDADPPFHEFLLKGCATCRGYCCETGKTHAYLDEKAIRRYMATHPPASDEEILADYLSYLPDRSYEQCCVFQGPEGCTLPRTKRAHICNTYLCRSLVELQESLEDAEQPLAVIGSADADGVLLRFAITDGRETRLSAGLDGSGKGDHDRTT